jgi:tellurite methyltransferase
MGGSFLATDWDKRYKEGFYSGIVRPHSLVATFASLIPKDKPIVDIAMGQGRDLLFLGEEGFQIVGLERSKEAVKLAREYAGAQGIEISTILGDANTLPFKPGIAGAVLVFYFLIREIMEELPQMLASGGILFYETFLKKQNEIDGVRNPSYLLDDGELITYFCGLKTLHYEEGIFETDGKRRALARYVGRKE